MPLFLLGFLTAYLGANIYLFIRSLSLVGALPTPLRWLYGLLFWLLALAMVLSFALRHAEVPPVVVRGLFTMGGWWMVFILYMLLTLTALDLVRLCGVALPAPLLPALLITLCVVGYGHWNYRHPKVEHLKIELDKPLAAPCRIVAVSDIHLGEGTRKAALRGYVELIMAQNPDLILIAGDLIDNAIEPVRRQRMEEELRELHAPLGVWMVAGNHEYISGIDTCRAFLEETPVRLLRDRVVMLPNGLQLIGRDDRSNRRRIPLEELMTATHAERPTLLVDHQPYELARADSLGVDLHLYGHTHHGQVWPLSLLTDYLYEQSHGYRKWPSSHAVVSSGLSLWGPPLRIGTQSDLWVIDLTPTP